MLSSGILRLLLTLGLLVGSFAAAAAESRVALVIGNSAYRQQTPLRNPSNDAIDIAASLSRLGFAVKPLIDATYEDLRKALLEFKAQAKSAEIAAIFFAGHGMEVGGENWLIPVDARLLTDTDAELEAFNLKRLMIDASGATKLGLIILDACRDNPFLKRMKRTIATRSVASGFAPVQPAGNVLVAYAAKDGTTALDGAGRNSPFTAALKEHILAPGTEIADLFRLVRDKVMEATSNRQQPYIYGSLSKEKIYLKEPTEKAVSPDDLLWDALSQATLRTRSDPMFKNSLSLVNAAEAQGLSGFLERFPNSSHAPEARNRLQQLEKTVLDPKTLAPTIEDAEFLWGIAQKAIAKIRFDKIFSGFCEQKQYAAEKLILQEFRDTFPRSKYDPDARLRIRELDRLITSTDSTCGATGPEDEVVWNTLVGSTRSARVAEIFKPCRKCGQELQIYAFEEFAKKYPNSAYAAEAGETVEGLREMLHIRIPPPKKTSSKLSTTAFKQKTFQVFQGVDFMGGDLGTPPTLRNVSHDRCRTACMKERACKYYAYSLWKRACYLKDQEPTQRVDAEYISASVTGVGAPPKSDARVTMRTISKKTFNPEGNDFSKAASLNECTALCLRDDSCQAVEFLAARGACYLFESGNDLGSGNGAVAIKYQDQ